MNIKNKLIITFFILSFVAFAGYNLWNYVSRDVEPPEISMDKDTIEISTRAGEEEMVKGITAKDAKDGDVTETLGVEKISTFGKNGTRRVTIVAFDSKGNTARAVRNIRYTDYTHPKFSLDSQLRVPVNNTLAAVSYLVHASDCLDGDITDRIAFKYSDVKAGVSGEYPVSFEVTNSAGDTQKIDATATLFVQNSEVQKPLAVLGEYIVYTKRGEKIDPGDYLEYVEYMGREYKIVSDGGNFGINGAGSGDTINRNNIEIDDDVDYDKPGSYEISYNVTDAIGQKGTSRLIVVVGE